MDPLAAETYKAIFEGSPDGVVVVDGDGFIRKVNPTAESLFGYARGELDGHRVEVLVPEELSAAHDAHRGSYAADPRPRPMGMNMELAGRRKDGSVFPAEVSLSPVRADGEPLVIATVRDVSQRKRLREFSTGALRASEEERQRIARELHDDTAQRLVTLLVHLRLLQREKDPGGRDQRIEQLRHDLEETADSVRRIARGLRPPELEDAGVGAALRAHARNLQEASGLRVEVDLESVDHLMTPSAKLVLYRVVQEALSNVVRHSGVEHSRVRVWAEDGQVLASVEDEGEGFDPGHRQEDGSGLGLVGMWERAVMIGGEVRIESSRGAGTRVILRLPLDPAEGVERG